MSFSFKNIRDTNINYNQYSKKRIRAFSLVLIIFFVSIITISIFSMPTKEEKDMTNLAKTIKDYEKKISDKSFIEVKGLRKSNDYAVAGVGDRTGAAKIFYRIQDDGNLSRVAIQQNFDLIYLLKIGIPLKDISNLMEIDENELKKFLKDQCQSPVANVPGYTSWRVVETEKKWALEEDSVKSIEYSLNTIIYNINKNQSDKNKKILCVSPSETDNAQTINPNQNITTSFQIYYIMADGQIELHNIRYTVDMNFNTTITLDENEI